VPFYGRNLPKRMHGVNFAHAKIRSIGERAIATLKTWKVLAKPHCCPQRAIARCDLHVSPDRGKAGVGMISAVTARGGGNQVTTGVAPARR
jgi:hypothetical protein